MSAYDTPKDIAHRKAVKAALESPESNGEWKCEQHREGGMTLTLYAADGEWSEIERQFARARQMLVGERRG